MWNLLIPAVTSIIDKIIPDQKAADEAKLKVLTLAQQGQLAELDAVKEMTKAQLEINQAEAASSDPYTSRWRPTIGYVLGAALAFQYLINPLIVWYAAIWQPGITPPQIGLDDNLWELMFGILGLAGWRTLDKIKAGSK